MAVPVLEGLTTRTGPSIGLGGTITVNVPAGTQAGDLLFAVVQYRDNDSSGSLLPNQAGWTLVASQQHIQSIRSWVGWRVATGSEPASYTWEGVGGNSFNDAVMLRISGVDTANPINAFARSQNGTQTAPSITTTVDDCLLLVLLTHNGGGNTRSLVVQTSGYTEQWEIASSSSGSTGQAGATRDFPTAGSTGVCDWNNGSLTTVDWQIAIAPGSGPAPSSLLKTSQLLAAARRFGGSL